MRHQLLAAFLLAAGAANASSVSGFDLVVLVDGKESPEFSARGTVYVEALRGRDYSLRLTNPTGVRVGVALSVDGLNTIDSRHTAARDARKWVLSPYETVVIPGWQVSDAASRKFVFTGERGSYSAALGKTQDLGVLEAVFFREKPVWRETRKREIAREEISSSEKDRRAAARDEARLGSGKDEVSSNERSDGPGAAPQVAPVETMARDNSMKSSSLSSSPKLSDEYAATGMGQQTRFGVTHVVVDLESEPAAVVRLRYEFRPQLVALGVLPRDPDSSRIARRERARGFEEFCPEFR